MKYNKHIQDASRVPIVRKDLQVSFRAYNDGEKAFRQISNVNLNNSSWKNDGKLIDFCNPFDYNVKRAVKYLIIYRSTGREQRARFHEKEKSIFAPKNQFSTNSVVCNSIQLVTNWSQYKLRMSLNETLILLVA